MAPREISDLAFLFSIVPVMIKSPEENRGGTTRAQYWYPPTEPGNFSRINNQSTGWCRWSARKGVEKERIDISETDPNDEVYSVFYNQENHHFLIVPLDCSRESIGHRMRSDQNHHWPNPGWFRLMFKNEGRMSELTHDPSLDHHLGGKGSPKWMPQLLPSTYERGRNTGNMGLTGKISLLVAIAAFTSEFSRQHFIETMNNHFRPPEWIQRTDPEPVTSKSRPNFDARMDEETYSGAETYPAAHDKGLIVRVRPDDESGVGKVELSQFEKGRYGCLINWR